MIPFKDIPFPAREPSPAEALRARQREMLLHIRRLGRQARGKPVREVAGYVPAEPLVRVVVPAADRELVR